MTLPGIPVTSPSIALHPADRRFVTRTEGVESRHCFSFGEHYDPANVGFGALLVSNEEQVAFRAGFGDHPHRDAEIVTWVLSGSLVHQDSSGHRGVVHRGLAQRMSAGSGIVHSERNDRYRLDRDAEPEPVHFVQMWLRPDESGGTPSYQQSEVDPAALSTDWVPVASGPQPGPSSGRHPGRAPGPQSAAVTVGTAGATLWVTVLAPGVSRTLPVAALVHVFVARGAVDLEAVGPLAAGDSVRLTGGAGLRVSGRQESELLVWSLAA